jgi:uncharacterized cupin superfamily protein
MELCLSCGRTFPNNESCSFCGPADAPAPSSAIPKREEGTSPLLELSEWLNEELVWRENRLRKLKTEFNKGALSAFESVAAQILKITAPAPPIPQSENKIEGEPEAKVGISYYSTGDFCANCNCEYWQCKCGKFSPNREAELRRDGKSEIRENQEVPEEIRVLIIEAGDKWARDHNSRGYWKSASMAYRFGCMNMFMGIKKGMYDKWLPQIFSLKNQLAGQLQSSKNIVDQNCRLVDERNRMLESSKQESNAAIDTIEELRAEVELLQEKVKELQEWHNSHL